MLQLMKQKEEMEGAVGIAPVIRTEKDDQCRMDRPTNKITDKTTDLTTIYPSVGPPRRNAAFSPTLSRWPPPPSSSKRRHPIVPSRLSSLSSKHRRHPCCSTAAAAAAVDFRWFHLNRHRPAARSRPNASTDAFTRIECFGCDFCSSRRVPLPT